MYKNAQIVKGNWNMQDLKNQCTTSTKCKSLKKISLVYMAGCKTAKMRNVAASTFDISQHSRSIYF